MIGDEQFLLEIGERPSARKVSDALVELGSVAVKQRCIELLQSGLTREQVNVVLEEEIIPTFNEWLQQNYECIMQMIYGDMPTRTIN